ncbi:MAG: FeoB-associated Cys-rich membrane protein [Proteobacteria bacterium]|nr:FeoB-associated Cys-rich membrane protein [Pseudomonadota bacterium]MBU1583840.1 FeoB-associated Cys-rich membrane protein [Pseudomonadota bacterium]MBU2452749.1 FeoB-associated Cys-rich membrane protein [Pseudomonadota bacterium]MBU2628619.1 FeoB-associated Cys-rich membrane protein [Pseudomonadota bacterium]
MDEIIVGIIIAVAIVFMVKYFITTYQGKKSCGCSTGCSCSFPKTCQSDFQRIHKK